LVDQKAQGIAPTPRNAGMKLALARFALTQGQFCALSAIATGVAEMTTILDSYYFRPATPSLSRRRCHQKAMTRRNKIA
jgi:hypothetical protein